LPTVSPATCSPGVRDRHVTGLPADDGDEFRLVVDRFGVGGVPRDLVAGARDRRRKLREEHGVVRNVETEFPCVILVVQPDTDNLPRIGDRGVSATVVEGDERRPVFGRVVDDHRRLLRPVPPVERRRQSPRQVDPGRVARRREVDHRVVVDDHATPRPRRRRRAELIQAHRAQCSGPSA
jgi:hypothetical protein